MNLIKLIVIGMGASALTACATTTESGDMASNADEVTTSQNERGEDVQCERIRETGSRFTRRVCTTARQREQMRENARQTQQGTSDFDPGDTSDGSAPGGVIGGPN